jgi:uncharacterized protein YwgA
VRVQKGLFLLAMRGTLPEGERYEFEPYNYGPMSRGLYADARRLCDRGLADTAAAGRERWRMLAITEAGHRAAGRLRAEARLERPDALAEVAGVRSLVDELSFGDLLELVYDEYPEFAARSVFRRR